LNALFIITLAPLFSKWWESKYKPSANMKFGIGMFCLGLGMAAVAIGMETAGNLGESIDRIAAENSMSYFFWILTFIPVAVGVVSIVCQPFIKKLMHDVK
jgi:dipeptide/tripeptide permease